MSANNPPPAQHWNAELYEANHAFVWKQAASLIDLLAPQPTERILDLGCGTGHLTAQLADMGATVVGLDHSAEMLAQARTAYPHLKFEQADARDFSFAEPFDAVFSNAALHWIKEPEAVIACVRKALRAGGRFVAEFGGRGNVQTILGALGAAGAEIGVRWEEPLWYFPGIAAYAGLLEAAGLEVRYAWLFDRPTPLEGPAGLRNWVAMFASAVIAAVPAEKQDAFLKIVEATARPELFREGGWQADYRRLRVVAVRLR